MVKQIRKTSVKYSVKGVRGNAHKHRAFIHGHNSCTIFTVSYLCDELWAYRGHIRQSWTMALNATVLPMYWHFKPTFKILYKFNVLAPDFFLLTLVVFWYNLIKTELVFFLQLKVIIVRGSLFSFTLHRPIYIIQY